MKRKKLKLSFRKEALLALVLWVFWGTAHSQATYTFSYTGNTQSISLLPGSYSIECWGGNGGWGGTATALTGTGGIGGYSQGVYSVTSPTILYIYVGGAGQSTNTSGASIISAAGGWNGGGGGRNGSSNTYYRGGGGGGSDVRTTLNSSYANRIIVAGGGGGAGGSSGTPLTWVGSGGNGGGMTGQDGVLAGSQTNHNGKGGSQTAGGAGGVNGANVGVAGAFGVGGDGGGTGNTFPAGGGGGGWYGGGGGATQGGGGAGGSGYVGGVSSGTTIMAGQSGFLPNPDVSGNGLVIIKELCSISLSVAGFNSIGEMCPGNTLTITTNAISNYSWTTGSNAPFLVVSPGTNTVYGLTAMSPSNCITSAQVVVNISATPTVSIINNNPIVCLGNQAVFSVSGADTYSWSTSSTAPSLSVVPTQSSTYSVTGSYSLSNCRSTETVLVEVFVPTVAISGNNNICKGITATLTANAAGATSYSWSTGLPVQSILVSPSNHQIYVVTAQVPTLNISCPAYNSVQVTVKESPNIVVVADKYRMCAKEPVALAAGGGTSYTWSWGSQTSNASSIVITPSVSTILLINVTGTGTNGCVNTGTAAIVAEACTGIEESLGVDNVVVYPNPSQGEINIGYDPAIIGAGAELLLIGETGQLIRKIELNEENQYKISIPELHNGIYFITGQIGTQRISKKIVVNR